MGLGVLIRRLGGVVLVDVSFIGFFNCFVVCVCGADRMIGVIGGILTPMFC